MINYLIQNEIRPNKKTRQSNMKIIMKKTKVALIPCHNSDYEKYSKLKIGWEGEVEFRQPRNYEFHKKFMGLVNLAFESQEKFDQFDAYRKYLTAKAGYYKAFPTDKGVFIIADSISFANKDEFEFQKIYSNVLDVVIKEIGVTSEEITKNLVNFM